MNNKSRSFLWKSTRIRDSVFLCFCWNLSIFSGISIIRCRISIIFIVIYWFEFDWIRSLKYFWVFFTNFFVWRPIYTWMNWTRVTQKFIDSRKLKYKNTEVKLEISSIYNNYEKHKIWLSISCNERISTKLEKVLQISLNNYDRSWTYSYYYFW